MVALILLLIVLLISNWISNKEYFFQDKGTDIDNMSLSIEKISLCFPHLGGLRKEKNPTTDYPPFFNFVGRSQAKVILRDTNFRPPLE